MFMTLKDYINGSKNTEKIDSLLTQLESYYDILDKLQNSPRLVAAIDEEIAYTENAIESLLPDLDKFKVIVDGDEVKYPEYFPFKGEILLVVSWGKEVSLDKVLIEKKLC